MYAPRTSAHHFRQPINNWGLPWEATVLGSQGTKVIFGILDPALVEAANCTAAIFNSVLWSVLVWVCDEDCLLSWPLKKSP